MLELRKKIRILKKTTIVVRESNSIFHLLKESKLKRYSLAYRIGYSIVDLIICQTTFMKSQLINAMPWMKKKLKLVVLPNPINSELIAGKNKIELLELNN
jgi:hypothetical protein